MKTNILKILLVTMIMVVSTSANAQDFEVDGLRYNILSEADRTVEVTSSQVSGNLEIPEKIVYDSESYTVTAIGENAFFNRGSLTSVTIPNSVISIGNYAFTNCRRLTSVTIPNSVTTIGEEAFNGCSGLTSVTIPNSVTTIGGWAFGSCIGLTSVTIPNSVTSIGNCAFYGCSGLTSMTIPNSVTSIGHSAFNKCIGLMSVTISNSVTTIGDYVFSNCSGLTSVTIPNSVTTIGSNAFENCIGLTSVTIPNSVTTIGSNAFENCIGLTSVTIPNSVTTISGQAFFGCESLKSIYCQWTEPIICDPFSYYVDVYKNAVLYVPVGCTSAYKAVTPWRNFLNIEEIDYSGVENVANDGIEVKVVAGDIVVEGCTDMEVYSVNGQLMYRGCAGRVENLAPGIYVVRAGGKTVKVMVAR